MRGFCIDTRVPIKDSKHQDTIKMVKKKKKKTKYLKALRRNISNTRKITKNHNWIFYVIPHKIEVK